MRQGLVVMVVAGCTLLAPAVARAQLPPPGPAVTIREVSRSSPIVAEVGSTVEAQYQGSFEVATPPPPVLTYSGAADDATFEFPYTKGHLRAIATSDIAGSSAAFDTFTAAGGNAIFDAADHIPSGASCGSFFTDACRTIFTTVATPDSTGLAAHPVEVFVETSNPANPGVLQPHLGSTLTVGEATILIDRIRAGIPLGGPGPGYVPALGGIDRSTLAIVESSVFIPPIAGVDRPIMIYVGALDGMLHAICAQVQGPCAALGQELWAFIPRTQLGALRLNEQRIDGSVKVADVFDDFSVPADGFREWRTVLTLQTGSGDPAITGRQPSVIAIDVSNPAAPDVLWERSTRAARSAVDQGVGLSLAMGAVRLNNVARNFTFVQTNNGGTSASSGFYLTAIDTATGQDAWPAPFTRVYPPPRNGANPPVPDSGIPGGAAAFDIDQTSFVTDVAVSTLYGDLWVIRSDTGVPVPTAGPIFRFSGDFQPIGAPPTIYFDQSTGRMSAVVVSGSYVDPVAATWVQTTSNHFAVSVALNPTSPLPLDEASSSLDVAFALPLGPNDLTTAQAIVQRDELFVTTDSTDVNLLSYGQSATGSLTRYSLSSHTVKGTTITIAGGASSTSVTKAGTVHVGSGGGAMKVDVTTTGGGGAFDGTGVAVERGERENNARLLWLTII